MLPGVVMLRVTTPGYDTEAFQASSLNWVSLDPILWRILVGTHKFWRLGDEMKQAQTCKDERILHRKGRI